ncbi:unnamed protein product [Sphagnum jensenii]|uniref:Uncharacterized protein n=1 Tax=Sphagnum jensenii TaxID=128206 RepID=A0ABP1BMU2_9BRYO
MGGGGNLLHGNGRPLGGGNEPLGGSGGPPSECKPLSASGHPNGKRPPGGGGNEFPIGSMSVPFDAPWPSSPWNPWCPPWYPPLAPTTPVAPSSRKLLTYPIYSIGTNSNVHV